MSKNALARYYSFDRLHTWEAKRTFLEPDLKPLPDGLPG